jgi:hypothetical protein
MTRYQPADTSDDHAAARDRHALRSLDMGDLLLRGNTSSGRRAGTLARWGRHAHHRSARARAATRSLRLARNLKGA